MQNLYSPNFRLIYLARPHIWQKCIIRKFFAAEFSPSNKSGVILRYKYLIAEYIRKRTIELRPEVFIVINCFIISLEHPLSNKR